MFRRLSFLISLLALSLLQGCTTVPKGDGTPPFDEKKTKLPYRTTVGAHRGDSVLFVENTPAAIRSALQNPKYAFIEFDVQYSSDKQVVVFHDSSLKRVFGHKVKVKETSFEELAELSDQQISTYEEIMELAEGKPINIEIKSQGVPADDEHLIDHVMDDLKRRDIIGHILISSISAEAIQYVKARYPDMPTGQIFWKKASTYLPFDFLTKQLYQEVQESKADYIMLHVDNLRNIKDLLEFKPADQTIVFWDFDDTMYVVHKDANDLMWDQPLAHIDLR